MACTGFHLSMGTGQEKAVAYAGNAGCATVQIFTHSPRSFSFKPLDVEANAKLLANWKKHKIGPIYSHCNYLINLASTDNKQFYGSLNTVKKELEYARAFGADYFVLHVGKHKEAGVDVGMAQIAKGINNLKDTILELKVTILLETVAGAGTEIGAKFEELSKLLNMFDKDIQPYVGVCVDTCHIFAAGYDIRTKEGVENVVQNIEKTFGIKRIKLIHVNDSKGELGDNLDRHEHLGQGHIGLEGLKLFLTHQKIRNIPMVLETPVDDKGDQIQDLKILNGFFR
jgi:deoxyribonuclease IV